MTRAALRAVALGIALIALSGGALAAPPDDPAATVIAEFDRAGPESLRDLVQRIEDVAWYSDEPEAAEDAWLVADEVAGRGRSDVARVLAGWLAEESGDRALAKALSRPRPANETAARTALRDAHDLLVRSRDDAEAAAKRLADLEVPRGSLLEARRDLLRARALRAAGHVQEASAALESVVEVGRGLDWPWARWILGCRSAALAIDARDPVAAARRARRLTETPEAGRDPARMAQACVLLGAAGVEGGSYSLARVAFDRATEAASALDEEDRGVAAAVATNHAIALERMGRYAQAHARFTDAEAMLEALLAQAAKEGGEAEAARWAVSLADAHLGFGALLFETGDLAGALGVYRRAEEEYRRALAAARDVGARAGVDADGTNSGLGKAIANQAEVHAWEGDVDLVSARAKEALAVLDAVRDAESAIATYGLLADGLSAAGRTLDAAAAYQEMRRRAGAARSAVGEAHGRLGTGEARLRLARAAGQMLMPAQGDGSARPTIARLLRQSVAARARDDLQEARGLAAQAADERLTARVLAATSEASRVLGDLPQAIADASEAVRKVETITSGIEAGDEVTARQRGRYTAAYVQGARAAIERGDLEKAVWFLEASRAHALLRAIGGTPIVRDALLPAKLPEEVEQAREERTRAREAYDKALAEPVRAGQRPAAAARDALDRAEAVCKDLEDRLRTLEGRAAEFARTAANPLEEVRRRIGRDQAFVWTATLEDEVAAVVLDADGARAVVLGRSDRVRRDCEDLRESGSASGGEDVARVAARALVAPLRLAPGVRRLVLSPQGPLAQVPWRTVLDLGGAPVGIDVALVPSGAVYVHLRGEDRAPGTGVLALGGCDYGTVYDAHALAVYRRGRPFSPLPASGREAQAVANQPGDEVLLGAEATAPGFRSRVEGTSKRRRAVHFACHGEIHDGDPMLSALALTATSKDDGFLRASDIVGMKIDADLATLSACETGLDREIPGEGFFGLTRAFMVAGVPRVLVSLWKADDDATEYLMREFYARFRGGMGASQALREAQAKTAEDPRWKAERYWAGWVIWGLGD